MPSSKAPSRPFGLPADCPVCAGELKLINSCGGGTFSLGIMRCEPCRREYEVAIHMKVHHRDKWQPREVA